MNFAKNFLKKSTVALASLVIIGNNVASAVDPIITATWDNNLLVNNIFSQDVEIKNIVAKLDDESITVEPYTGIFSSGKEKFGIDRGIVISNAPIDSLLPPSALIDPGNSGEPVVTSAAGNASVSSQNSNQVHSDSIANFNDPGPVGDLGNSGSSVSDEDIKSINGGLAPKEVVSLEFDFVPKGKKVSFEYVFGSKGIFGERLESGDPMTLEERYNKGSAMGIWVNGQNRAFIPGTNLPVNTVNIDNEKKYVRELQNEIYTYRTPAFTAEAQVTPNEVNHVKISFGSPEGGLSINSAVLLNGTISDFPQEEPGVIEEEPKDESGDKKETEKIKEVIENPKTGDLNLAVMTFSTLASVSGLVVLVKKYKKI